MDTTQARKRDANDGRLLLRLIVDSDDTHYIHNVNVTRMAEKAGITERGARTELRQFAKRGTVELIGGDGRSNGDLFQLVFVTDAGRALVEAARS